MAKKQDKYDLRHKRNIKVYELRIDAIYREAIREAVEISGTTGQIKPDTPFSFDDYPITRKRIESLMSGLKSSIETVVLNGIKAEWTLANNKNSELANRVFGNNVGKLTQAQYRRYYSTNDAARLAFQQRKVGGLNLSDRVWRYTNQFKEEIEMGLDIGIRNGRSADELSRDLRQYLKQPDKLFRRVRDEHGQLQLSKRAKAYHPGQGVYRSSYKNARRLAATETNIAYRTSDYIRWQQMDFVVGIEIHLSNNHTLNGKPFHDICDELAGKYPKDFKFTGWHPHCRCFATSILKTPEEIAADTQKMLNGEPTDSESVNRVRDVPQAFKDWIINNRDRIERAKSMPYFIADNHETVNNIINTKALTPLEKAKLRHKARTPEQIADIKARAVARQKRLAEERATRKYGERIKRYMDGISDVDTSALYKALQAGDTSATMAEAQNLKSIGKKILALAHLDNPMQVARTYSMADAIAVNNAVDTRIAKEISRVGSDLHRIKSFLESEIKWVEDNKKYATWKAAQDAYKKELLIVDNKIAIKDIAYSVDDALAFSTTTKSKVMKELAVEMKAMLSSSRIDIDVARAKAKELNNKYNKLKAKSTKVAKIGKVTIVKGETIDEMKKRLGSKMPRTLENLEKAISNYEKTLKYGDVAKNHKAEIEELMRKIFDEHDLGMNIDDDVLEAVLNSWFKNTFETGSSGGYLGSSSTSGKISSSHERLKAAHMLFGLSKDLNKGQLSRHEYEKYGNLLDHDIAKSMAHNTTTQYGNVEVRFKKDKVIATWTAGDSLGKQYQPSLVSDPRSCSFDDLYKTPTNASIQVKDLAKFKRDHISSYLELQYHGDLTIDCVESLTFIYDLNKSSHSKYLAIARKWKAAGAKIYYIDDNGDLKQL